VQGVARFGIVECHAETGILVFNPVFSRLLNQKFASLTSSLTARLVLPSRQRVVGLASDEIALLIVVAPTPTSSFFNKLSIA
jgi:hypothetical protein